MVKPGKIHEPFDLVSEAVVTSCSPHQPQFEDVIMSATLDRLVPGVVGQVVVLVLLEEVACVG